MASGRAALPSITAATLPPAILIKEKIRIDEAISASTKNVKRRARKTSMRLLSEG